MAASSARELRTKLATIYVDSKDDLDVCRQLRGADGRWTCLDVTAGTHPVARLWKQFSDLTGPDARCRGAHLLAPSRLLKMAVVAGTPHKRAVFLDADTVPCFPLDALDVQLRATEGRGLLDAHFSPRGIFF